MSSSFSFSNLIYKSYKDIIAKEIEKYLASCRGFKHITGFEKYNNSIKIIKLEPKGTYISSYYNPLQEFKLAYYSIVKHYIKDDNGDELYSKDINLWVQIVCSCSLDCGIKDFKLIKVESYEKGLLKKSLFSDSLVPNIYRKDYDRIANQFLSNYYPDLIDDVPIKAQRIVQTLGLQCKQTYLSKDPAVIGQISFFDTVGEVYDKENDCYIKKTFPAKTIIIDSHALSERHAGSINNAIIHECIHWVYHRYAIELRRINDSSITNIRCLIDFKSSLNDDNSIMERQARGIAPKVLLPKKQFILKAKEYIETNQNFRIHLLKKYYNTKIIELYDDPIYSMDLVIDDLSQIFGVSKLAAKIRLSELGFNDAKGSLIYLDEHYVPCHKSFSDFLDLHETYAISSKQFSNLVQKSKVLNILYNNGKFIFVDNFFCINHPKFIYDKHLTPYARTHMDECYMVFSVDFELYDEYHNKGQYYFLYSDIGCSEIPLKFIEGRQEKLLTRGLNYAKEINYMNIIKASTSFERTFNHLCEEKRKELNIQVKTMAIDLGIDPRTLKNYRDGNVPSIEVLLAITLYLGFSGYIINALINHSPYKYDPNNVSHQVYEYIVSNFSGYPYPQICNEIKKCNARPLI